MVKKYENIVACVQLFVTHRNIKLSTSQVEIICLVLQIGICLAFTIIGGILLLLEKRLSYEPMKQ